LTTRPSQVLLDDRGGEASLGTSFARTFEVSRRQLAEVAEQLIESISQVRELLAFERPRRASRLPHQPVDSGDALVRIIAFYRHGEPLSGTGKDRPIRRRGAVHFWTGRSISRSERPAHPTHPHDQAPVPRPRPSVATRQVASHDLHRWACPSGGRITKRWTCML